MLGAQHADEYHMTAADQHYSNRLPASIALVFFASEEGITFEVVVVNKSTTDFRTSGDIY